MPEQPSTGETPVEQLLAFMYANLTSEEIDAMIDSLARHKGVQFPGTLHDVRLGFIIENYTRHETRRFLDELKRRQRRGEPLVRRRRPD